MTSGIRKFYSTIGSLEFLPNFFEYLIDGNSDSESSIKAPELDITSSVFLLNMGVHLTVLFGTAFAWPVIFFADKLNIPFVQKRMKVYLNDYKFSFYLRFWIQSYLDFGVYSFIQLFSVIKI